jgi:ribosomal-protein-alanine N-acetyltransferase
LYAIRSMRPTDLTAVAALERDTLSPWSITSLEREMGVSKAILLVAEKSDGEVVGWCGCRVIWPEAELMKIAVKLDCRASGVAGGLFEDLFARLQGRNVTSLFLEVRSENRAALSLYKKNGFSQVGIRPRYYVEPDDGALILRKILVPSS